MTSAVETTPKAPPDLTAGSYAAAQEEWPQAQCEAWWPVVSISAHFSLQNFFPSRSIDAFRHGQPRCWQFMGFSFLSRRMEQFCCRSGKG